MKNMILKLCVVLIILLSGNKYSQNSNFDFSPMETFWEIHSLLSKDMEPQKELWNKLFNHKGYQILNSSEFSKSFFINHFRLAYKPSLKKELREKISGSSSARILSHYTEVTKRRDELKRRVRQLVSGRYNYQAVQATSRYLPRGTIESNSYPPVTFLIFANDGRGSSPIIVDLLATITWDFIPFLSHEYHHWYREKILKYSVYRIEQSDRYLWNALELLEAEGIADLVDKREWFDRAYSTTSSYAQQFIRIARETPKIILKMNNLLEEIEVNKNKMSSNGRAIKSMLAFNGHPNGYFMAYIIEEFLGRNDVLKCVGDPAGFLLTYNKAAKASNGRYIGFSPKAISVIKQMQKKYINK